jgi:integrase
LQDLRAVINWGIAQEIWTGENPATRIKQFHEEPRTRFLAKNEIRKLFRVLASREPSRRDVSDFILLALLTGARKSDIVSARWDKIAFETRSWEIPNPKNKKPYRVALTPEAVEILERRQNTTNSPWVFPRSSDPAKHILDFKRSFRQVLNEAGIENLRQHDLRRTLGAMQAEQGASLQVIGGSLGHKSLQATQVYSPMQLSTIRSSVELATQAMFLAGKANRQRLLKPGPTKAKRAAR